MLRTRLSQTLNPGLAFQPEEIVVAVGLPLERWHFLVERYVPASLLESLGLSRDFVRNGLHSNWRSWWKDQLLPAIETLQDIERRLKVTVIQRVTLRRIKSIGLSRKVRLLFLIAHHPIGVNGIELYNGVVQWDEVAAAISKTIPVLMVCGSGDWMRDLLERRLLPAGCILREMPVREGCEYMRYLVEELIKGFPLHEAEHRAKDRFLTR